MRQLSVKTKLNQTINSILGESSNQFTPEASFNAWSMQEAIIENIQRVVRAEVGGNERGKIKYGLDISDGGSSFDPAFTVYPGIAFTPDGDIIIVDSALICDVNLSAIIDLEPENNYSLYLKHIRQVVPADEFTFGKKSNFIDGRTSEDIVTDDLASFMGDRVGEVANQIIIIDDENEEAGDRVYLGPLQFNSFGYTIGS